MESTIHVGEPFGRVLVSGASGLLGSALLQLLLQQGVPTLQLVRGQPRRQGQIPWNPAAGKDATEPAALDGCVAAIHLSGASVAGRRWTRSYRETLTASRVETTRALAETLAAMSRKPEVLVVASAVGIYGNRGDEMLDESAETGTGFLADLCRAWEAAAEPAQRAGIRVVHARFGVVLGRGGALDKMLPAFKLGLGGPLGNGRQWMSWVSLEDAARALLFAIANQSLQGAMNVTAPSPVTNIEFTRTLGRALHRPTILPAPAFALRLAFGQMAEETLLASQRVVPKQLLDAGFEFKHTTVDEALRAALA